VGIRIILEPLCRLGEAPREQRDVEAEMSGPGVNDLFFGGEQVE